ncbi:MAG: chromate transporter [Clostridia bacterium]|nr:chromate transporter [Clostridia bacterium]
MKKLRQWLMLFLTMVKIGAFTFGGGIAMLALLENEFVSKRAWMTKDEFLNMTAIAESTPGPIAINAATYLGYKQAGFFGALFATVGVVIPSFVIIYLISLFLDAFLTLTMVAYAFQGIRAAVVYLILSAGVKMLKAESLKKPLTVVLISFTTVAMVAFSLLAISFSSIVYILLGGVAGLATYLLSRIGKKEGSV